MSAQFSVYQFFADGKYERVLSWVDDMTAVKGAAQLTNSVGARTGITRRVIITDGLDFTVWEWKFGEGVVYPPPEAAAATQQQETP
jgi:hypothetical protein